MRKYIRLTLGSMPITKITAKHLEDFYAELRRCRLRCYGKPFIEHRVEGEHECRVVRHRWPPGWPTAEARRPNDCNTSGCKVTECSPHACRPLSAQTIRQIHFAISATLAAAVRWEWIKSNPAAVAKKPRQPAPQPKPVLGVDLAAAAAVLATAAMVPISGQHLVLFAVLAVLSGVHLEFNRRIERLRELATEGITFTNFTAIWTFAGLLLMPPPLVAALIVVAYTHMWFRIRARVALHRWVFTAATVVLASAGTGAILAATYPLSYPGFPIGWFGIGVVAVAAIIRWSINSGLVFGFMAIEHSVRKRSIKLLID